MHRRAILALVALLATGQLAPASAQTPVVAGENPVWPAIGQITYGNATPGAAICTGTLVAANLVLTARHCLQGHGAGQPIDPASVNFAPGWPDGSSTARRSGSAIILSALGGLAGDVALLILDRPVPPDTAIPIALATGGVPTGTLPFVGYGRDSPDIRTQHNCPVRAVEAEVVGLGCTAVSGNSGAPLLILQGGVWHLAAVMVARARTPGPIRAYAVVPDAALAARIAQP